jgi:hypothetical protein
MRERENGEESKKERLGVELPYLFYIPSIGECCAIDLLESVRPGSEYLSYQVCPPPREGIICSYPSWSALVIKLNHLPGKLGGGLFVCGIIGVYVGIQRIWWW